MKFGRLYIVATPIGNLEDITLRGILTLKNVDAILCEDTRTTGKLLKKYQIATKTISYNAHATKNKHEFILKLLEDGKELALVSDAGTPGISDPGSMLIEQIRKSLLNIPIIAIPGASAVIAALSVCGFSGNAFTFFGFAPQKKGRQTFFETVRDNEYLSVFYESPHRFAKTIATLAEIIDPNREVAVCRELTKVFEESKRGTIVEIAKYFNVHPEKVRGEFVIIVAGLKTRYTKHHA